MFVNTWRHLLTDAGWITIWPLVIIIITRCTHWQVPCQKGPPPFICSRILWFIFLAFILILNFWKCYNLKFWKLLGWIFLWQIRILVRIVVRSRLRTFFQKCREVAFFSKIWHVAVGAMWTNQVIPRVNFCHMACHVSLNSTSTNQRLTRVTCATWQCDPLP
jgi:hypothetical protein